MENMADDYAKVIQEEFDGKIYGIMGISYGGMILHHFAGKYEDLVQKIIIISAAYKISQSGANYDKKFVENHVKRNTQKISLFSKKHDDIHYEEDILIEAEAELNYDPLDNIKNITKEILIICGDSDFYFPIENFRETHELIPTSTLIINHGKGHGAFLDKKGIQRIQQWLN